MARLGKTKFIVERKYFVVQITWRYVDNNEIRKKQNTSGED
jgi:hypothetical protein